MILKKPSISDVQPEVNIFYFLREACTLGARGYFFLIDPDGSRRRRLNEEKNILWNPGLEACPRSPYFIMRKKNSNSTSPNKSKDHCVKNNVHFYNKKWNVS